MRTALFMYKLIKDLLLAIGLLYKQPNFEASDLIARKCCHIFPYVISVREKWLGHIFPMLWEKFLLPLRLICS